MSNEEFKPVNQAPPAFTTTAGSYQARLAELFDDYTPGRQPVNPRTFARLALCRHQDAIYTIGYQSVGPITNIRRSGRRKRRSDAFAIWRLNHSKSSWKNTKGGTARLAGLNESLTNKEIQIAEQFQVSQDLLAAAREQSG